MDVSTSDGLRPVYCALLQEARLKTIDHQTYLALREGAEVLEIDHCGDKVLRLKDGTFLKLFRRKRLISSALWYPYAQRFADNAESLLQLGVSAPSVLNVIKIPSVAREVVIYEPVPGKTLRELVKAGMDLDEELRLRRVFCAFVSDLLDQGVYFRSMHLGNVVLMPDGKFGLIDVADVKLYPKKMRWMVRRRFFNRIERFGCEKSWFEGALKL